MKLQKHIYKIMLFIIFILLLIIIYKKFFNNNEYFAVAGPSEYSLDKKGWMDYKQKQKKNNLRKSTPVGKPQREKQCRKICNKIFKNVLNENGVKTVIDPLNSSSSILTNKSNNFCKRECKRIVKGDADVKELDSNTDKLLTDSHMTNQEQQSGLRFCDIRKNIPLGPDYKISKQSGYARPIYNSAILSAPDRENDIRKKWWDICTADKGSVDELFDFKA